MRHAVVAGHRVECGVIEGELLRIAFIKRG
jgi:hypothetical protein